MKFWPNLKLFILLGAIVPGISLLGGAEPVLAQEAPRKEAPPKEAKRGPSMPALPKTAAERDKALGDLYALLATAEDENTAKVIAEGIERIWVHSGSATVDLLLSRAMKSVAEKNMDRALKLLDNVVEQAPDFTEGWSRRAYVYFQRNQVGHALGDLRRALALDPNHFKALDGLAQVLREIGQKKAALQVFRHLHEVHPYWPGTERAIDELMREVEGQGI
jgi:tetratricopeptide (TPR) repeat protein